mgnify:CR=1 FL=1
MNIDHTTLNCQNLNNDNVSQPLLGGSCIDNTVYLELHRSEWNQIVQSLMGLKEHRFHQLSYQNHPGFCKVKFNEIILTMLWYKEDGFVQC